jgi:hypothetical protein
MSSDRDTGGYIRCLGAHAVADPARAFMVIFDIRSVAGRPVALPRSPRTVPAERRRLFQHSATVRMSASMIGLAFDGANVRRGATVPQPGGQQTVVGDYHKGKRHFAVGAVSKDSHRPSSARFFRGYSASLTGDFGVGPHLRHLCHHSRITRSAALPRGE